MRWTRDLGNDSDWSLQAYYDRTIRRYELTGFREARDTIDIDFQHRFPFRNNHSVIWGMGVSQQSRPHQQRSLRNRL